MAYKNIKNIKNKNENKQIKKQTENKKDYALLNDIL